MYQGKRRKLNNDLKIARVVLVLLLFAGLFKISSNWMTEWVQGNVRIASCQLNMGQLGLALGQYAQDNDNDLPSYAAAHGLHWREAIYSYVKAPSLYHCWDDKYDSTHDSPTSLPTSYAANLSGFAIGLTSTAQTVALVDTRGYEGEEWSMTSTAFLPTTGRRLYAHFPQHLFYQHPAGKLNVLFTDGHVKRVAPMETLTPVNLWTPNNQPFAGQDLANAQAILKRAESE